MTGRSRLSDRGNRKISGHLDAPLLWFDWELLSRVRLTRGTPPAKFFAIRRLKAGKVPRP